MKKTFQFGKCQNVFSIQLYPLLATIALLYLEKNAGILRGLVVLLSFDFLMAIQLKYVEVFERQRKVNCRIRIRTFRLIFGGRGECS